MFDSYLFNKNISRRSMNRINSPCGTSVTIFSRRQSHGQSRSTTRYIPQFVPWSSLAASVVASSD